jgi:membrane protein DedA with SNARE-associated domain/membrane-associated phospholipid phosphatase
MEALLDLTQPWAYVLVALLAAAEGSLFVGLLLPGEASLILGGVLAFQGHASLLPMLAVAWGGAVAGDCLGYLVGHRYGRRLQATAMGRRIGEERWHRAGEYVRVRGGRAVFLGKFVGFLRSLVPAIAGMVEVPFRTFFLFDLLGSGLWGSGFVLLGYGAGGSWRAVSHWAGRAGLVLGGLLLLALLVALLVAWARGNRERLLATAVRAVEDPRVARVRARFAPQLAFVRRRLDPTRRTGLYLTAGLAIAIVIGWLFGSIVEDVLDGETMADFDRPVRRFFVTHRADAFSDVMRAVSSLGDTVVVVVVLGIAAVVAYLVTHQRRWAIFVGAALVGAMVTARAVEVLVARPEPSSQRLVESAGGSFPSSHAVAAAAMCTTLAYLLSQKRDWRTIALVWGVAGFVSLAVAVSRVYLGAEWPTDVLAGLALGTMWTAVTATSTSVLAEREKLRDPS